MKIEFVGGARTVTGSSFILTGDDFTIMVDCGMFQGKKRLRDRNFLDLIYAPSKIDILLLTHAHIDHCGLIPKLIKEGFENSIYATEATVDLCSVMLPDSAHIQEMDTEWINRKNKKLGRDPVEPLYTTENAEAAMSYFVPVKYDEIVQVHPSVKARFRNDGHILGSSFIELWATENGVERKIVFSGDVGSQDQAIIRNPEKPDDADMLLIESTYGDRLHKSKKDTYEEFKDIIVQSHNNRGNIIIPSFAVERTQEIIYTLGRLFKSGELPDIPVYIDSPLAISATEVFRKHPESFDDETKKLLMSGDSPLDFPNLHFSRTTDESKRIVEEERGAIILSASGMCTAGRIKFHLQNNLWRPESSVIFVGYQAEGTLGRRLIDGAKMVSVYGDDIAVRASIYTLGGFSAHADRDELLAWMSEIKNPNPDVFVVHGEESSSLSFAKSIEERFGFKTSVPMWGEIVDLESMKSSYADYSKVEEAPDLLDGDIDTLLKEMQGLAEKYRKAKEQKKVSDAEHLAGRIKELRELIESVSEDI